MSAEVVLRASDLSFICEKISVERFLSICQIFLLLFIFVLKIFEFFIFLYKHNNDQCFLICTPNAAFCSSITVVQK